MFKTVIVCEAKTDFCNSILCLNDHAIRSQVRKNKAGPITLKSLFKILKNLK